jgi:type II secretory pathway predicted ATPase ExeA
MTEVVQTADVKRCELMIKSVLKARPDARFGQIIGSPGTGKTLLSRHLADNFKGVRVCASAECRPVGLITSIAKGVGLPVSTGVGVETLLDMLAPVVNDQLIFVDEANHLNHKCLETLRFLPDECGAAVVVLGTPLLDETFKDGRTAVYLDQLRRRIGGKRVVLSHIKTAEEIANYIIEPRFGKVTKTVAKSFLAGSRGDWGTGLELADTCARVMEQTKGTKLDETIVASAREYLAA